MRLPEIRSGLGCGSWLIGSKSSREPHDKDKGIWTEIVVRRLFVARQKAFAREELTHNGSASCATIGAPNFSSMN